jgi:hypothetical protein
MTRRLPFTIGIEGDYSREVKENDRKGKTLKPFAANARIADNQPGKLASRPNKIPKPAYQVNRLA